MSTISKRKQKVLIWFAYYLNEGKTFWFGLKFFFIASRSFPFWPKICGTKQSNLNCSGNCQRQSNTFSLIQKLTNRSKRFWFGSLIIGMKAKDFDLVQNIFFASRSAKLPPCRPTPPFWLWELDTLPPPPPLLSPSWSFRTRPQDVLPCWWEPRRACRSPPAPGAPDGCPVRSPPPAPPPCESWVPGEHRDSPPCGRRREVTKHSTILRNRRIFEKQVSRPNVQNCRNWIVESSVPDL
jgi:hypothetical protein